ncbi:hypothetical protein BKA12_000618 [Neomicrococcus lactis]|uniref:Uncharacterized protein n=1 Tax=Neomicrococcus lactis TaxID=732241 RepID=A0A7W8Y9N8_9MICC|nr:hypothetical protein [Neomicrococcus lactis]
MVLGAHPTTSERVNGKAHKQESSQAGKYLGGNFLVTG